MIFRSVVTVSKMFSVLVIFGAIGAALAHPPTLGGRIYGGKNTPIESRPYQVSLHSNDSFHDFYCGGCIVDAYHVITAAHCVTSNVNLTYIRAGSSYHNAGGRIHYVDKAVYHEKYYVNEYQNSGYDVAVIRVKEPFVFDDKTQPIELFRAGEKSIAGFEAVVSGWGLLQDQTLPDYLQSVTLPIVNTLTCNLAYRSVGGLDVGQICAGYYGIGKKSPCSGDSGGPLTIKGRLAGIVSYGEACGHPYYPGIFTEVAYFRDWINKHLKI